jgi:hypothetical protein
MTSIRNWVRSWLRIAEQDAAAVSIAQAEFIQQAVKEALAEELEKTAQQAFEEITAHANNMFYERNYSIKTLCITQAASTAGHTAREVLGSEETIVRIVERIRNLQLFAR